MFFFFKRPHKLYTHQVPPKSACMGQKGTVLLLGAACLADSSLIHGISRGKEKVLGTHGVPNMEGHMGGGKRVPRAGLQTLRWLRDGPVPGIRQSLPPDFEMEDFTKLLSTDLPPVSH